MKARTGRGGGKRVSSSEKGMDENMASNSNMFGNGVIAALYYSHRQSVSCSERRKMEKLT